MAEFFPVFSLVDDRQGRAQHFDAVFFQNARFGQRHGGIEAGLAAQRGQKRVGALPRDDFFHGLGRDRSTLVRSAISGSVMIVAGFELMSTTSYPTSRRALQACVPE
jgi:hypothetical protein